MRLFTTTKQHFAATRCVLFWALNASKMHLRSRFRPKPHWGSLQRSPDSLAGPYGTLAKNIFPAFGLEFRPFGPQESDPHTTNSWPRRCNELMTSINTDVTNTLAELTAGRVAQVSAATNNVLRRGGTMGCLLYTSPSPRD